MATDFMATGAAWLADMLKTSYSRAGNFVRGTDTLSVQVQVGGSAEVPYAASPAPLTLRKVYVSAADLLLGGVTIQPATGDLVQWTESGQVQQVRCGPWGPNRTPAVLVDDGATWEIHGEPVGAIAARRNVLVTIQVPNVSATRNEYGETPRATGYSNLRDAFVELEAEAAGEQQVGGRMVGLQRWRAYISATDAAGVTLAARLLIKSGPYTGRYISVEGIGPVPGLSDDMQIVGRMTGG